MAPDRRAARQTQSDRRDRPQDLTLVYYGLRDGEIRCLAKTAGDSSDTTRRAFGIGVTPATGGEVD